MPSTPESDSTDLFVAWIAAAERPCPNCGYALAGLRSPLCPECGAALRLRICSVEPRAQAYLFGLIGLGAGLGFCAIFLLFILMMLILLPGQSPGPSGPLPMIAYCVVGSAATGFLLRLWWKYRRAFLRRSMRSRTILAAACWAFSGAVVAGFALSQGIA